MGLFCRKWFSAGREGDRRKGENKTKSLRKDCFLDKLKCQTENITKWTFQALLFRGFTFFLDIILKIGKDLQSYTSYSKVKFICSSKLKDVIIFYYSNAWEFSFLTWEFSFMIFIFFCHLGVFLFCSLGSFPKLVIFCAPPFFGRVTQIWYQKILFDNHILVFHIRNKNR